MYKYIYVYIYKYMYICICIYIENNSVPCPFLADIAYHYVSLCRSLISLPPPSFLILSLPGESS